MPDVGRPPGTVDDPVFTELQGSKPQGSPRAIRARLVTAVTGGGLLTILFQALGEDYGVTVGQATQKFLILLAAAVFGYAHVDHTER